MAEGMQQGKSKGAKWVMGCGLGCLAAIVIAAIGIGITGYFGWRYAATEGKTHMASEVQRQYQQWLNENEMPAEYASDYDALVAVIQQEDTSLWAAMTGGALIRTTLQDNVVAPEEAADVAELAEQLRANPNMSMMDMQEYMQAHPELQEAMQTFQAGTIEQEFGEEPPAEEPSQEEPLSVDEAEAPIADGSVPASTEESQESAGLSEGEFDLRKDELLEQFRSEIEVLQQGSTPLFTSVGVRQLGSSLELTLVVTPAWYELAYQLRLDVARAVWTRWAEITGLADLDKARLSIESASGSRIGGSRVWAGSLIWVEE